MLRILVNLIIGGVIGAGIGFAGGIFVYPYIFLADVVANETLDASNRQAVADGTFIHANPSDPVHYGKGPVTVFRDLVRIENGFEVGPGPKYHVYLVKKKDVKNSSDVKDAEFKDLGRLRGFRGSQNYPIPEGVNPRDYASVVIWCETFGVLISPASLTFKGS